MMMLEQKTTEFLDALSSSAPVPGGGGASALVGAIGTALGNMVGSLTVGKKKYADVEEEMYALVISEEDGFDTGTVESWLEANNALYARKLVAQK